jgi:hypothetical protein
MFYIQRHCLAKGIYGLNKLWLWQVPMHWPHDYLLFCSTGYHYICLKPSIAAAEVQALVMSCGICGGQSGTWAGFLWAFQFPLTIIPLPAPHSSSSIIRDRYNRPKSGRLTKWTQFHPHKLCLKLYIKLHNNFNNYIYFMFIITSFFHLQVKNKVWALTIRITICQYNDSHSAENKSRTNS